MVIPARARAETSSEAARPTTSRGFLRMRAEWHGEVSLARPDVDAGALRMEDPVPMRRSLRSSPVLFFLCLLVCAALAAPAAAVAAAAAETGPELKPPTKGGPQTTDSKLTTESVKADIAGDHEKALRLADDAIKADAN